MLEFKKKTRAHKWRNYAVYGLLTLSQLSKTGYYPKSEYFVNRIFRILIIKILKLFRKMEVEEKLLPPVLVRLAAHVSNGLKSRIRPVVGRI